MQKIIYSLIITASISCSGRNEKGEKTIAQSIVDKTIQVAGSNLVKHAIVDFDFRGRHYRSTRDGGLYKYQRIFSDSLGEINDVLDNNGFERYLNDSAWTSTPDSMKVKYARSVNSVLYFALLPYGLNDAAVNKKLLGESVIDGTRYYEVEITFGKEGGGEDHQDVFVYWINKELFIVDYVGYSYETDGGGMRFRSAYNPRTINGIRFVDYVNYKPDEKIQFEVSTLDSLYNINRLKELSKIELKDVSVEVLK